MFDASISETGWKQESGVPVKGGSGGHGWRDISLSLSQTLWVWILAEKKEENMDGSSAVLQEVDRDGDLAVPRSSFWRRIVDVNVYCGQICEGVQGPAEKGCGC